MRVVQRLDESSDCDSSAVSGCVEASGNVLTRALLAVPVGPWLDRHGGRALMTTGSLAGAALLMAWAHIDSAAHLYAVQIGIGSAASSTRRRSP
jgi:nitrate/nitrite transporter NarK